MTVETLGISKGRPQKGKLKKAGGQEDQITLYDWRVTLKLFRSTHRLHPTGREREGVGVIGVKRRDGGRLKRDELKCSGSVKAEGGPELKSSLVSIIAAV